MCARVRESESERERESEPILQQCVQFFRLPKVGSQLRPVRSDLRKKFTANNLACVDLKAVVRSVLDIE